MKQLTIIFTVVLLLSACTAAPAAEFTPTATLNPTATATPLPTLTPTPTPIPVGVSIDFSQPELVLQARDAGIEIEQTDFSENIHLTEDGEFVQLFEGQSTDVRVSMTFDATATSLNSPEGGFLGLYCRYQDADNFIGVGYYNPPDEENELGYGILQMQDGMLEILGFGKRTSGGTPSPAGSPGESEAVEVNGESHTLTTLTAECLGDTLTFRINDLPMIQVYTDFLSPGQTGLAVWGKGGEDQVLSLVSFIAEDIDGEIADSLLAYYDYETPETSRYCMDLESEDFDPHAFSIECVDGQAWLYTGFQRANGLFNWSYGTPYLRDASIEMDVTPAIEDDYYGVVCRATNEGAYVALLMKGNVALWKIKQDEMASPLVFQYMASLYMGTMPTGESYHLKMDCVGDRILVQVNDVVVIDVRDENPFEIGAIGIGLQQKQETLTRVGIDNLTISAIRPEEREVLLAQDWDYRLLAEVPAELFTSNNPGAYSVSVTGEGIWQYQNDGYEGSHWFYYGPLQSDQSISAVMQEEGIRSEGLICRGNSAGHYLLRIRDTFYYLEKYNRKSDTVVSLLEGDWGVGYGVILPDEPNLLELSCRGDEITVTINGEELARVQDDSFKVGVTGLYVEPGWDEAVLAVWDMVIGP